MLDHTEFNADIGKLLSLIERRFGFRSDDLGQAMRKIGRRLPKSAHRAAGVLIRAQCQAQNPKTAYQLQSDKLIKPYATLLREIEAYDRVDRRKGLLLGFLGTLAFQGIVIFALIIGVLIWRGYL
ncbi:hypothetical protein N6L24_00325 [Cognatishimia sp. SS12]|uniref:hypothetical protein n=1 Tax=Cognatishimia sp. SS12 TaxID=2979465 RepID=UPI00232DB03A|nr:hypothetical protein [Cognatishimia sp. SS12]MDC0736710.1 hypothetical protein [Cognatishimia sp. SS12]